MFTSYNSCLIKSGMLLSGKVLASLQLPQKVANLCAHPPCLFL